MVAQLSQKNARLPTFFFLDSNHPCYDLLFPYSHNLYKNTSVLGGTVLKVAKHSFLVPMSYSSLFSNHWQLGGQNWQDASSTLKGYFLIFNWAKYCCHDNTAGKKPALKYGFALILENPVMRLFSPFVS